MIAANDPELVNKRIHNTHDERPQPSVKDRMGLFFLRALLSLPPWHSAMVGGFVFSFSLFTFSLFLFLFFVFFVFKLNTQVLGLGLLFCWILFLKALKRGVRFSITRILYLSRERRRLPLPN